MGYKVVDYMVKRQKEKLAKAERSARDFDHLKKTGPRSGDLGRSFERGRERVHEHVKNERALLERLHELNRSHAPKE